MRLQLCAAVVFVLPAEFAGATPPVTTATTTVLPFAVPVATPIAVVNPGGVLYAYGAAAQPRGSVPSLDASGSITNDASTQALWQEFLEFRRFRQKRQMVAKRTTQLEKSCAQCHAGNLAKGDFHVDRALTADARLQALQAILSGEMPKNAKLSSEEREALLRELTETGKAKVRMKNEE